MWAQLLWAARRARIARCSSVRDLDAANRTNLQIHPGAPGPCHHLVSGGHAHFAEQELASDMLAARGCRSMVTVYFSAKGGGQCFRQQRAQLHELIVTIGGMTRAEQPNSARQVTGHRVIRDARRLELRWPLGRVLRPEQDSDEPAAASLVVSAADINGPDYRRSPSPSRRCASRARWAAALAP